MGLLNLLFPSLADLCKQKLVLEGRVVGVSSVPVPNVVAVMLADTNDVGYMVRFSDTGDGVITVTTSREPDVTGLADAENYRRGR